MEKFDVDEVLQQGLDRLTLLTEVATALSSTLDADKAMHRVCRIMVPALADWCAVDLVETPRGVRRVCATHREPEMPAAGGVALGVLPAVPPEAGDPMARVLRGAGPLLLTAADLRAGADGRVPAQHLELFGRLDTASAIIAPLRARRQVLGVLTLARADDEAAYTPDDLALVDDLAHRIALSLDNARLHGETQRIAERLQRSLLPTLPDLGDVQLTARYTPSVTTAEVGGDWYDSFTLPNGHTTLIIGDVTGHDLRAAVRMSQLRNMLRGIACDREEPPGQILRRLDLAQQILYTSSTATCIYAVLETDADGSWMLRYAQAGHPPPLVITPEGDTEFLEEGCSMMLGITDLSSRPSAATTLVPGSTVLLYTDGLIERRGESIDHGLTRLRQHAAALVRQPLEEVCDELLTGLAADHTDDVALLALRLPQRPMT
ncbi:PP2C family protein-serine/threonine phosphatase [Streptomyces lichenis]|uniref:SpoIIE family protein phosphatase n=1 Tax=Streptomyces lichenis TaxID=2306967 RepID=A0ABT0I5A1_9ACTN|nr:SpoIIE family protein phosphatase [Streptomyces lichenis]MCK8676481.1 SpoIIE family protein phosphatase [Streptomyces lichenis]